MPTVSDPSGLTNGAAERTVVLPKHLHARPAGQVAQAAARHRPANIELVAGARRANATSILAILGLGATIASEVLVRVEGPSATAVLDEICEILIRPEDAGSELAR
jgi:phosphocarrier protein HPr